MNEAQTRHELINPALAAAGWGVVEGSKLLLEVPITLGRLQGAGKRAKADVADYLLVYRNHTLAVVEAKKQSAPVTEGVGQAKKYAEKLQTRFTYATNGVGIYQIDMATGEEGPVAAYPTPDALWDLTFAEQNQWRDRFAAVAFEDKSGTWQTRYYQAIAIDRTLEAIAAGKDRILLTLATGTGKTMIAFQLAWKLYQSRWNLSREPTRRPRILFLADRNILANQAYNDFSSFPEDALVRIQPDEIRKKGKVPKNGSVFFTIFQTFMTGKDAEGNDSPSFGEYPSDFFDFIVIDECHRGGAKDESNWRAILEYFKPAVQLGLTATPKRKWNIDTYKYFGEPVYSYSLKEGINDGFLTPFKVKQIATTLDDYTYTSDDTILDGEVEAGKLYVESDFNRIIQITEREKHRVRIFMDLIDQKEKTLVFCATQDHALIVRDLVNQMKASKEPNYCVRVTANDGEIGDQFLRTFQDNEKTIPTILTTSQKLSTGVNARNVRNIVLMRPINSMIEFKQIIGRGTRLFDGKDHFTIYDFVQAYHHFQDAEWDGEPQEPVAPAPKTPHIPVESLDPDDEDGVEDSGSDPEGAPKAKKVIIKLADGKERTIQHMMVTSFWGVDGKPISAAEFLTQLFGALPELFRDEDELRKLWSDPETRQRLLQSLEERNYGPAELALVAQVIDAERSDLFDVLAYVAFALPPLTRRTRVETNKDRILESYDDKQQAFLEFVLGQYVKAGVGELDAQKLPGLLTLKYHGMRDATAILGSTASIRQVFVGFQKHLYERANV